MRLFTGPIIPFQIFCIVIFYLDSLIIANVRNLFRERTTVEILINILTTHINSTGKKVHLKKILPVFLFLVSEYDGV